MKPNELIQALLGAPVDLLWNGGMREGREGQRGEHADAGDKANDAVRVNASELRAEVDRRGRQPRRDAGPGGWSSRSPRAGGRARIDDFRRGASCWDREVNIKILNAWGRPHREAQRSVACWWR